MKKILLLALILTINVCFAVRSPMYIINQTADKTLYFSAILGRTDCLGETYETYIRYSNYFYCPVAAGGVINFQTLNELRTIYPTMEYHKFQNNNYIGVLDPLSWSVENITLRNLGYNWSMFRYKIEDASRNHTEGINNLGFSDYANCHPLYTCWGKNENLPGYDPNDQILPGDPNCPQNSFMNSGNTETFSFTMFEITGERFFVVTDFN